MRVVLLGLPVMLAALAACSASGRNSGFDTSDDAGPMLGAEGGSSGGLGGSDGGPVPPAPSGAPLLYAHTDTTLFQLDPGNIGGGLTTVGDFDCVGTTAAAKTMTDVAVAKDGKLFGVSEGAAFPLTIQGKTVHQVGLPFHWGYQGAATGSIANDLTHLVLEPNVSINEVKAIMVDVQPGRLDVAPPGTAR